MSDRQQICYPSNSDAESIGSDISHISISENYHTWLPLLVHIGQWASGRRDDLIAEHEYYDHCIERSISSFYEMLSKHQEYYDFNSDDIVTMSVLEVSDHRSRDMLQVVEPRGEGDGSMSVRKYDQTVKESIARPFKAFEDVITSITRCKSGADPNASLIVSVSLRILTFDGIMNTHQEAVFLRGSDVGAFMIEFLGEQTLVLDLFDADFMGTFHTMCDIDSVRVALVQQHIWANVFNPDMTELSILFFHVDECSYKHDPEYRDCVDTLSSALVTCSLQIFWVKV